MTELVERKSVEDATVEKPEAVLTVEGEAQKELESEPPVFGGTFAGKKAARKELVTSLKLVGPVMISNIIALANNIMNTAFMGRVGTNELSAAALGVMLVNVTGNSFVSGICTALDTLCSQAHGANCPRRVGVLMNRGIFVVSVLAVIMAILWGFAVQPLLELMGQEHVVALLAQIFTRYMIIGILPLFWFEAVRRTLAASGVAYPQAIASLISVLTVLLFEFLFVNVLHLGVEGSAVALSLGYWAQFISCILIARTSPVWRTHTTRFTREVLHELVPFMKLAIPGCVMVCAEWWAFEIAQILAGTISAKTLSALSILMQLSHVLFQIPFSFATACSSRVGNHLGNGDALLARTACALLFGLSTLCEIVYLIAFFFAGPHIGKIFTHDPDVIRIIEDSCVYTTIVALFDGCQGCLSGILRGAGKQGYGAIVNLVSFYVVGLPLEFVFVYTLRPILQSIYLGLLASPTFQVCLFIGRVVSLPWDRLAVEISARERRFKTQAMELMCPMNSHAVPLEMTYMDETWGETVVVDVNPPLPHHCDSTEPYSRL